MKRRIARAFAALLLASCGKSKEPVLPQDKPEAGSVRITWLGRAYFLVETASVRIAIDPCKEGDFWKAPTRETTADLVLTTHDHGDHDAVEVVKGAKATLRSKFATGEETAAGVKVKYVLTDHDDRGGRDRGKNTIYVVELEGLRIAHAGDLGHVLTDEQVKAVGSIDILLLPVGGRYTLELNEAGDVCDQLKPRVVIPMHAKTEATPDLVHTVDEFARKAKNVRRIEGRSATFSKSSLPSESEVVVLRYQ